MDYLQELNQEGYTLILVTHDPAVVARASRVVRIAHGRVVSDKRQSACSARSKQPAVIPRVAGGTRWFEVASQGAILGWRCLYGNLFRTMLTLAGFIIGVAAILVTLAVSEGGRLEVLNRIAAVGTNLLIVRPGGAGIRTIGELGQLQPEDAAEIKKLDNIELASPERGGRYTVRAGGVDYQTTIIGTSAEFVVARSWPLASGAFFSAEEEQAYAPIAVLGKTVEAMLFPDGGSVGRHVLLMGTPYEVIGVLSARGGAGSGADQDDMVVIPLSTSLMRLFGRRYVNIITVRVHEQAKLQSTRNEITRLLMDRHRMRQFQTVEMSAMIALGTETHAQLTLTLSIVSVVSLVLAGGGMMNVMLAGLFERAREIGIRQISGAQPWSIILQLNVEAVVFGTVGGFLGALLGWVTVTLLSALGIPTMIGIGDVLLAFGCACFFAAAFGHIPARHASKLSPARAISWR